VAADKLVASSDATPSIPNEHQDRDQHFDQREAGARAPGMWLKRDGVMGKPPLA
jgi:hypothetical protein